MNRLAAICSFAALIPLATGAMERTSIEKELNELNVNAEIVGSISEAGADDGQPMTAGVQVLEVTNNDEVAIHCEVDPAPSDGQGSSRATIESGASATLQLGSDYASATTRARLICRPAD
jgi:aromatic ring hydroxylase